jgi:hypothetical protein
MLKPRTCVGRRSSRSRIKTNGNIRRGCYGCSCARQTFTFQPGQPNPVWSTVTPCTTFTCVPEEDPDQLPRPNPPHAPICGNPPPKPQVPAYWHGACNWHSIVNNRWHGIPTPGAAQRALVAAAASTGTG